MYLTWSQTFVHPSIFTGLNKDTGNATETTVGIDDDGKDRPDKNDETRSTEVSPNQMMANGIHARGGIGPKEFDEGVDKRFESGDSSP